MELSSISHIEHSELTDFEADIFITTLGYESRCTTVAKLLESSSCRKIALSRTDHSKDFSFSENKSYYLDHQFEVISVESRIPDFETILQSVSKENLNILIDCTSMSPRWYFECFRWFYDCQESYAFVKLRFVYTMACYEEVTNLRKVTRIREFIKSEKRNHQHKKTALILGLGHEENVSETIFKLAKPDVLYLFYADPPVDKRFVDKLFVNNHGLINETSIRNLIAYPVRNGQTIYQSLIDTILPLRTDHYITLIPQGPKIFSVAAMLVHFGYPDTAISYPVFKKPPAIDRKPCGDPVVLDILFEGED